jgi:hypothetical protein
LLSVQTVNDYNIRAGKIVRTAFNLKEMSRTIHYGMQIQLKRCNRKMIYFTGGEWQTLTGAFPVFLSLYDFVPLVRCV